MELSISYTVYGDLRFKCQIKQLMGMDFFMRYVNCSLLATTKHMGRKEQVRKGRDLQTSTHTLKRNTHTW